MRMLVLGSVAVALTSGAAQAAPKTYALPEPTAELKAPAGGSGGGSGGAQAAGFAAAQAGCLICHSADYVAMQPPRKGQAFWEAEVTKMIKVYHAPIAEADAKAIAAYLTETY